MTEKTKNASNAASGNRVSYKLHSDYEIQTSPIVNPLNPSLRLASLSRVAKEVWRSLRNVSPTLPVSEYFILPTSDSGRSVRIRLQHLISHVIGLMQQAEQANVDFNNRYLNVMREVLEQWYISYLMEAGRIAARSTSDVPDTIRSQVQAQVEDLLKYLANRHIARMVPFGQVTRFFELIHGINTLRATSSTGEHPNLALMKLLATDGDGIPVIYRLYHVIYTIDTAFESLNQSEVTELSILLAALSTLNDHIATGQGGIVLNLGQGRYLEIPAEVIDALRSLYSAVTVYASYEANSSLPLKHILVEASDSRDANPWSLFSVLDRLENSQVVETADMLVWYEDQEIETTDMSDEEITDTLFGLALGTALTAMLTSYGPESVVLIRPLASDFFSTIDAYLSQPDYTVATPLISFDLIRRYLPSEWSHANIARDLRVRLGEINNRTLQASQSAQQAMRFADEQLGRMLNEGLFRDVVSLTLLTAVWHAAAQYKGRRSTDDKLWRAIASSSLRVDAVGPTQAMTDVARMAIMAGRIVCEAILAVVPRVIIAYERVFRRRNDLALTEIILRNIGIQLLRNPEMFVVNLNYQRQNPKEVDFLKGGARLSELLNLQPEMASGIDKAIDLIDGESQSAKMPKLRMTTDTYYRLSSSIMRVHYSQDKLQLGHYRMIIVYPDEELNTLLHLPVFTSHISTLHMLRQWLRSLQREGLATDASAVDRRQYVYSFRKIRVPAAFPKELVSLMRHVQLDTLVETIRERMHAPSDDGWLQDLLDHVRRSEQLVFMTPRQLLAKVGFQSVRELEDMLELWGINIGSMPKSSFWTRLFSETTSWLMSGVGRKGDADKMVALIETDPIVGLDVAYVDDVMTLGNGYVVDPVRLRTVRCPDTIAYVVQHQQPSLLELSLRDRVGQALTDALIPELTDKAGLDIPAKTVNRDPKTAKDVSEQVTKQAPRPDITRDDGVIRTENDSVEEDEADDDDDYGTN